MQEAEIIPMLFLGCDELFEEVVVQEAEITPMLFLGYRTIRGFIDRLCR